METPIYIIIANNELLFVENIKKIQAIGKTVLVEHVDKTSTTYVMASEAAAISAVATITNSLNVDTMNPPKFDSVNSEPGSYIPPDQSKGCMWFGVGGTFYSWNPTTLAWVGLIVV